MGAPDPLAAVGRRALHRRQPRVLCDAEWELLRSGRADGQGALVVQRRGTGVCESHYVSHARQAVDHHPDWRCVDRVRTRVMRTPLWIACCWTSCVVSALGQGTARESRPTAADVSETNPYSSAADLEIGRRLYLGRCGH